MQTGYDNSTQPQIVTDTVRGQFQIKRGTAADSDVQFEILNAADGVVFSVTAEGNIVLSGVIDGRDLVIDGDKLDLVAANADVTDATNVGAVANGIKEIYIPIHSDAEPTTTNGAPKIKTELTAAQPMLLGCVFDGTTRENVQFSKALPKSWNAGTVTFIPHWTSNASGVGTVQFGLESLSLANDDAIDSAFGTAQVSLDTFGVANDMHIGPESSAITIGGGVAKGEPIIWQVYRDPAVDTKAEDVILIGVTIRYTTDALTDA